MSAHNILDQPLRETNHQPIPSVGWWFEYAGLFFLLAAIIAYFLPNTPTGDYAIYIYSFKGLFLKFAAISIFFHIIGGVYLYVNRTLRMRTSLFLGQVHFILSMITLVIAGAVIFQLSKVDLNEADLGTLLHISSIATKLFIGAQVLLLHLFFGERD